MGYNATYGLPLNDSMSRYNVETSHKETENFLETDELGNLHVKQEFALCDVCNEPIGLDAMAYVHGSYLYCRRCEMKHRANARREMKKNTHRTTTKKEKQL